MTYDIIIVGAGASGLAAAITAGRRGKKILIIDKNKKCGQKLYATGNGRCNLTNLFMSPDSYYENDFAFLINGTNPAEDIISFFNSIGIYTYDRDGYVYPMSNQASSVVWALKDEAAKYDISFRYNHEVKEISKDNKSFKVTLNNNESYISASLLLATGGFSYPKLGSSDESIYSIYDSLNIKYKKYEASLCPLIIKEDLSPISGVRTKGRVSVTKEGKTYHEEGEIQFTDYGISGIVIFNMSYYLNKGDKITLDLIPDVPYDSFKALFNKVGSRRCNAILNGLINDKLASFILDNFLKNIDNKNLTGNDFNDDMIHDLYHMMKNYTLNVKGKMDFDMSQASSGGILTYAINPDTMEIRDIKGLYASGEATDVLGKCGGYNLTYAFLSGIKAGRNM